MEDLDVLLNGDHIRLLLAIVEARSFTGAAAALGVSQPFVSQQVKRLEAMAGRTLFQRTRTRSRVALTSHGEAVVIYARAMAALTRDLRRHLDDAGGPIKISVGMSEDFCRTALPGVLGLFMREHPRIAMSIVSGHYEYLRSMIESRAVDLAVMRRSDLIGRVNTLWVDELLWVGRLDLPLPVPDVVPLVLPVGPSPVRDIILDTLRSCGRSWRIPFESLSLTGVEAALQAGLGVCAGPRRMHLHGLGPLPAASGLPKLPDVEFVITDPDPTATDAVRAFAEVLRRAAITSFERLGQTRIQDGWGHDPGASPLPAEDGDR